MIKTNILGDTSKLEFKVKPLAKKILKCVCKVKGGQKDVKKNY